MKDRRPSRPTYGGRQVARDDNKRLAVRGTASLCGPASSNAGGRATGCGKGNNHNTIHSLTVMGMSIGIPPCACVLWAMSALLTKTSRPAWIARDHGPSSLPHQCLELYLFFWLSSSRGRERVAVPNSNVMRRGGVVGSYIQPCTCNARDSQTTDWRRTCHYPSLST